MLGEALRNAEVVCAHIVDDAFDPVPRVAIDAARAQAFADALQDEEINVIAAAMGLTELNADSFLAALQDVSSYARLFSSEGRARELSAPIFEEYLADQKGKLAQVQPVLDMLRGKNVECLTFGADYDPHGTREPQLIFIDLKLDEGALGVTAEDAVKAHRKLMVAYPACRAFVFLMSSRQGALSGRRDDFRREAELFASQFEAVEKQLFEDADALSEMLARYIGILPTVRTFENHFVSLKDAMQTAAGEIIKTVKALDFTDYLALYNNTTKVEEIKLGTYITELLLEYVAHKLEGAEEFWRFATTLDALENASLPRARFGLSFAAGEIYSANMVHAKRRLDAEVNREVGPVHGYFYLGDIFFTAQELSSTLTKAYVVITPACDLARPEDLRKRSLILCEGKVREAGPNVIPTGTDTLPVVVMPHPNDSSRQILIEWQRKKLLLWGCAEMDAFRTAETCVYVRHGRLRPLYALQLQHAVTSDLSRIGTQRPPGMLQTHGLQCFIALEGKWCEIELASSTDVTSAAVTDSVKNRKAFASFIIADMKVQLARRLVLARLPKEAPRGGRKGLDKVVRLDDFIQSVIYYNQKLPEKGADYAAYPFAAKAGLDAAERKIVAIVRPGHVTPYDDVANNVDVNPDTQCAQLIFVLREVRAEEEHTPAENAE